MTLTPFIELSPTAPNPNGYNPSTPDDPWAYGTHWTFGGFTSGWSLSIDSQASANEIIIGYDPGDPADENDLTSIVADIYRRCAAGTNLALRNIPEASQLLLVYGFGAGTGDPSIQFFVGSDFVRTEPIRDNVNETVALLLDVPAGDSTLTVYTRLASPNYWARVGVQGVTAYLF